MFRYSGSSELRERTSGIEGNLPVSVNMLGTHESVVFRLIQVLEPRTRTCALRIVDNSKKDVRFDASEWKFTKL